MTAPNLCLNRMHADMKRTKKGILFPTEMLFLFSGGNRNKDICVVSADNLIMLALIRCK